VAVVVINMVRIRHLEVLQVLQRVPARSHRMLEDLDEKADYVVRHLTGAVVAVVVLAVQEPQR
jgi:hypothetical protein